MQSLVSGRCGSQSTFVNSRLLWALRSKYLVPQEASTRFTKYGQLPTFGVEGGPIGRLLLLRSRLKGQPTRPLPKGWQPRSCNYGVALCNLQEHAFEL